MRIRLNKITLFLSLFVIAIGAQALTLDNRRQQIISIIDEELSEVSRLNKQSQNRNPDHLLRMAELNLEKARLWREKENQSFLALEDKDRRKAKKSNYFKKSARFFKNANDLCLRIVKRFKKYRSIGDVYYILGYNAKEAGKQKTALKYFSRAQKKTSKKSITRVKSQISQAELYYNQKKYKKAIPLYEKSLRSFSDKWWTKDSFNLAWCYFRSNKYSKAISKMKEVFSKSGNRKYIDMRTSVERDIGLFFATAGKIEDGIAFYKKIGINFTDQLLRIAVTMKGKGQYSLARKTLNYALKYEKREKKRHEIYIEQLDLYASFRKRESHIKVARTLFDAFKRKKLSSNKVNTLKFHAGKQGAILQKQVVSKTYKRLVKQREAKAVMAIEYFGMLAVIDPKKSAEYQFLQGETAFTTYKYTQAINYYNKSFDSSIKLKDSKFKKRSMDGLLSSLGKKSVRRKVKESYYIPTYNKYLNNFPKGKKSLSIYQKLFKVQLDRKQYLEGKKTLDRFKADYPKNWKIQEAMIAELMEIDRKKKRNNNIRLWIKDIDAKKYFVSKRYAKKLKELLTSIQIDDVQLELKKGNKKEALVGYHKLLEDPNSTKRSRINAKYNLAALYYELGSVKDSFKWSNEALNEMSSKETIQFSDSFLTISTFLFTQLEFEKSAELASRIVNKLCKRKSRKKQIAFKNAAFMYLADNKLDKVEQLLSSARRCKISNNIVKGIRFELLSDYLKLKNWRNVEAQYSILSKAKSNWAKLIIPSQALTSMHSNLGNNKEARRYRANRAKFYQDAKKSNREIPVKALDSIAIDEITRLEALRNKLLKVRLVYPASKFQQAIKSKFSTLDRLVSKASSIQSIGSGNGIVKAYKILIDSHYSFVEQVRAFTPNGMKKEFVPLFKKDMEKQIIAPLLKQATNYEKDAKRAIAKNEILSPDNTSIGQTDLAIRFWYPSGAILMDRAGK